MRNVSGRFHTIRQLAWMLLKLSADAWRFLVLCLRPAPALAAEILFLRKQLALYEERQVKPRRATKIMGRKNGLREDADQAREATDEFGGLQHVN